MSLAIPTLEDERRDVAVRTTYVHTYPSGMCPKKDGMPGGIRASQSESSM